jgi:hypothetical protein
MLILDPHVHVNQRPCGERRARPHGDGTGRAEERKIWGWDGRAVRNDGSREGVHLDCGYRLDLVVGDCISLELERFKVWRVSKNAIARVVRCETESDRSHRQRSAPRRRGRARPLDDPRRQTLRPASSRLESFAAAIRAAREIAAPGPFSNVTSRYATHRRTAYHLRSTSSTSSSNIASSTARVAKARASTGVFV